MFSNNRRKEPAISTLVGRETEINGDLQFTGGCLVNGFVRGNVSASEDEHATLNISEQGSIEGNVEAPVIYLNGTVKGDVRATQRIELGSNACVNGNVQYRLIEMAIGAEVNGKLIHESETETVSQAKLAPVASVNAVGDSS